MVDCPKCKKQSEDGARFCEHCGTRLYAYETVFCINCGTKTSTEFTVCKNCGAPLGEHPTEITPPKAKKSKKKLNKKAVILGGIAVALAIIIFISCFFFLRNGGSYNVINYALYLKEQELFYVDFSDVDSLQVTSRLVNVRDADIDNKELSINSYTIGKYCMLSKDGNLLFYPDRVGNDYSFSLYCRNISKPDEQAIKIDSDIISYQVNDAATIITYIKGEGNVLYQYDLKRGNKTKIDSNITAFELSNDGKKIRYINDEGSIYLKYTDKEREKVAANATCISYITEDFTTVYYIKDGSLYKQTEGQDRVKIASEVSFYSVLKIYESGEIYYLKSNPSRVTMMDYINDDLKDSDAKMMSPVTSSVGGNSKEAEEYENKLKRDEFRETMADTEMTQSDVLCYFDGEEETIISDTLIYTSTYGYNFSYSIVDSIPVIVFWAYDDASFRKIKMSEIDPADYNFTGTIEDAIRSAFYSAEEKYISIGGSVSVLGDEQMTFCGIFSDAQEEVIFYRDDDDNLYKSTIEKGDVTTPEFYDSDVQSVETSVDGHVVYFKDYNNYSGDLYINKAFVDYDVRYDVNYNEKLKRFVFFVDWDDDKECGTLKVYENGQTKMIADEVHEYTVLPNGDVLYLYDYSMNYYKGELAIFRNGKTERIDDDVISIIPYIDTKIKGETYDYGW